MSVRIIPRLDIKGPNLVKGIHLEGLRVLGKPEDFANSYYVQGADELFFQDIVASLYERNSLTEIITRIAENIFIPLTVGGGLRTIDDIRKVLRAGADKVAINTAVIKRPGFIREASNYFGSSTIVVSIEAIKQKEGNYLAYIDNGREFTGIEVISWAQEAESLGAGEILITSVDKEGTGEGFDHQLVKAVSNSVSIPVIAHGGAGSVEDVAKVITSCNIEAVSIASVFHYGLLNNHTQTESNTEGNFEFINSGANYSKIQAISLRELKKYLHKKNIDCRYIDL